MDKHLEIILNKMYECVGADYYEIQALNEEDTPYFSWAIDDEEDFVLWLTNYFNRNLDAQKLIKSLRSVTKKTCELAAREFVRVYGFKKQ
jgi:hypothetical protein